MRPLLVLSLVIVAVATLLFALFSLGGEDPVQSPLNVEEARGPVAKPAEPEIDAPDVTSEESKPTAVDRTAVSAGRDSVNANRPTYDNGLSGRVFDPEGKPLAGVRITVVRSDSPVMGDMQKILGYPLGDDGSRRTSQSDPEGRYRFRNLEPGMHFLTAVHKSYSRAEVTVPLIPFDGEIAQDVTLENGVVVHGYVRGPNKTPLVGARLTLGPMSIGHMAILSGDSIHGVDDESLYTSTDEKGYYRLTNVTPGTWNLTAAAEGFGSSTKRNRNIQAKGEERDTDFDFDLEPGAAIAGRVYAPDRTPIASAQVEILGYQDPQSLSATTLTDPKGEFHLPDLVPGAYFLRVRAEGWGEEKLQRVEAPDSAVQIEMSEQGTVMGRVVSADNRTPVTSFTASLHQYVPQSSTFGRAVNEQKFDSPDGTFAMKGVEAGLYGVKVEAPGCAATYSASFEVVQGLATTDVLVRMSSGGSITGKVVDAKTGEPIAGAAITTHDSTYSDNAFTRMFANAMPRRTTSSKTRTDKDGVFEIALLSPELYQVQIKHPKFPDHVERNVRVTEGERTDLARIEVPQGGTVEGTVFDAAGNPLPGAVVQLIPMTQADFLNLETRTGTDGRYVIPNVLPGPYRLSATRPQNEENPFRIISDMRNSQIEMTVIGGQKHANDLTLGG